jgi:hypothetical protein
MSQKPKLVVSHQQHSPSLAELLTGNNFKDVDKLSTDAQTLFGFITLIVDIEYRLKYGGKIDGENGKDYNGGIHSEVLADQIPPVDHGLLGM